ncbi:MAG: hypothetical protein CL596_10225 [Alteromonas sp.]|nr:hypothetical protein [Alteromonas sp.]MAY22370.1 hypothetical protein [Flavobacteriaceae bacterium]|tara:strand:- start:68668 stop:69186 length:519 start_codon:yes stop_codon:yes gene_type:complete
MKYLLFLLLPVLVSCGAAVAVDYEPTTDFSGYTSYNYYPTIESGLNDLDNKRIMAAIDSVMTTKGFEKTDTPQIWVNFYASEQVSNSRSTIGIGIGGGGGNVGVGVNGGIPIGGRQIDQQFTIDFVDKLIDLLVWQGVYETSYKEKATPLQKEAHYYSVVQKILKKYPPKEK